MPKKLYSEADRRDWNVLVRFRSSSRPIIEEKLKNWQPPIGERQTISAFVRHLVWLYCRGDVDKTNG